MSERNVLDLLCSMIRFPSLSGEEDEICAYMQSYVDAAGIQNRRIGNSLYFWIGSGTNKLLLASHLDVVPPSSGHPYPPFDAAEVNGRIYGRGASDAKASGAAMTSALLELAAENWHPENGQVIVALTECEETHYEKNGLRRLLKDHLLRPQAALIGEPTSLIPTIAQKGLLVLRLDAKGKSAHAARHALGENAILQTVRDIQQLSAITFDRVHPVLGPTSLNVTTIQGGTARNVIPDQCTIYLDIRSTPSYTHEEIVAKVREAVSSEVTVHSDRIVPVSTKTNENIVDACLEALPGTEPAGSPTASDWVFLKDVPTVKIGPGHSELSHTAEECVDTSEVMRAVDFYKSAVKGYFEHSRKV